MTYAGDGKVILTTEIKLKLNGKMLKLSAIEEALNNGSGFSFPTPSKWRTFTGTLTSTHLGQISILLGGDNHLVFLSEVEHDSQGVATWSSIKNSISSSIIKCFSADTETLIATNKLKHLVIQPLDGVYYVSD